MWTNMAGLQEYNETTGGHFNHIVPLVPMMDNKYFYKLNIRTDGPARARERERAPAPNPPTTPNPEVVVEGLPNGWCPGVHEECNHLPGIPPESCGNSILELFM